MYVLPEKCFSDTNWSYHLFPIAYKVRVKAHDLVEGEQLEWEVRWQEGLDSRKDQVYLFPGHLRVCCMGVML